MLGDAIFEASRLLASLCSMRATQGVVDELALSALEHGNPCHQALDFVIGALERIEAHLPHGILAGFVRVRIHTLAGIIVAIKVDAPTPAP